MLWVYALLVVLAGVVAGYFAGFVPIIVVSVIGIVFLILMLRGDSGYSGDAGPGIAVMGLALLLFLVSMGVTALVVRLGSISAPDFSVIGSWLKKVLLR